MFERFTERARKVVVLAQEEAARLRHGYVGTEHLLLGLIREEEGVAAQSLRACGVALGEARGRVEAIVGYGEEDDPSQMPFTQRSKRVLELALREAQDLRHDHIGTEHLLLGLLAEGGGIAAAALSGLGVDPERVRREVVRRLPGEETGHDVPEETAPIVEGEEAPRLLFWGRVGEVRAELDLPRPVAVAVEADYSYLAPSGFAEGAATVEPGDVVDVMRSELEEADVPVIEAVIAALGESLLDAFPNMLEVSVAVSDPPGPSDQAAPNFSVSATFRR